MKRKSTALMISAALMAAFAIPAVVVQAAPVSNAEGTQAEKASLPSYDEVFEIPAAAITSITNNAGNYGASVIANAVDGKTATHWETNKPNSASFNNKITVTFDKPYELSKLLYLVRQDGAGPKGFPLSYNLYYSTTASGDDFKLLKAGSFAQASRSEVEMKFEPTTMQRIQLEFVQAQNNWASASEISFYKYDSLAEQMDQVFTDKTYSALSPEFQDISVLEALEAQAEVHPNAAIYLSMIEDAKTLLENPNAFQEKIFTASQRGNVGSESSRTQTGAMLAFDPTGYYVTPGETITVYVEADPNGVMPKLAFGQIGQGKSDWRRFYDLKPGINVITAQDQSKMNPAAIYLSNEALPSQQAYAPKVRILGGTKFPMYVHGKTSTQEFLQELETYMKNVSYNDTDFADGNPNGYYFNIAEITSENNIVTTSAAGAYKEVKNIIAKGSSVEEKVDAWEDMYYSYAKYSGFDLEDQSSSNYMPRGKFMSRVFCNGPFGWADYGYTGYNGGNDLKRDNGFFSSIIGAPASGGWAVYHEWGHIYENKAMQRGESTNNLFSLLMQDKYAKQNRMVAENRWELHFTNYHNTKQYPNDLLFYGAFVYQLEPTYGHDLYGRAAKLSRENPNGILNACTNRNDRLAVCLSLAAGVDLTGHFDYYTETVSDVAKAIVADLPKPEKKAYYNNNKSFESDAAAFTNPEAQPVVTTSVNKGVVLNITIDEPVKSVLCHEIYRDGTYLGVTYGSTFTDKTAAPDTTYGYTVITYDRKLNISKTSEEVQQNTSAPVLNVVGNTVIKKGTEFHPLDIVTASDVQGQDISSSLQLTSGSVDTNHSGIYPITITAEDAKGNRGSIQVDVQVADQLDYVSDLNPVSAAIGYGKLGIDKAPSGGAITLLQNGKDTVYAKGLGTHAESAVIYDLTDKGYSVFETMLGIDQAMKGISNSSVTFEIWLDNEMAYQSPVMYSGTDAKHVVLDVTGVKQLKLVAKAGANNYSDHAVWGGIKLATINPIQTEGLKEVVSFAQQMTDRASYQKPSLNHKEDRWISLQIILSEALAVLENMDATQQNIDDNIFMVKYYLEENGQTYQAGKDPVCFAPKKAEGLVNQAEDTGSDLNTVIVE